MANPININNVPHASATYGSSLACKHHNFEVLADTRGSVINADFYIFSLALEGELHYEVFGRRGIMKPGSIMASSPHTKVRNVGCTSQYRSCSLFLDQLYFDKLLAKEPKLADMFTPETLGRCPVFNPSEDKFSSLVEIFNGIEHNITVKHKFKEAMLANLLCVFLLYLGEDIETEETFTTEYIRKDNIYRIFVHQARKYFRTERQMSFYADKLCITPDYLSRVVKEVSGGTAYDYISDLLYKEICDQLLDTDRTINEIAIDLNFNDQSALNRFFKQRAGISPANYRKSVSVE